MHFDGVVARATTLQAQSRFQTASAMRQALANTNVAAPSSAVGSSAQQRSTQRQGGRWSLVVLAFVAVVALAVGILTGNQATDSFADHRGSRRFTFTNDCYV
ncbi:MAG: hypothetical protein V9H69_22635 [Anaerolineae bacterium]